MAALDGFKPEKKPFSAPPASDPSVRGCSHTVFNLLLNAFEPTVGAFIRIDLLREPDL